MHWYSPFHCEGLNAQCNILRVFQNEMEQNLRRVCF